MSASETLKPGSAAPEQRAHEPSMEEILASIRRIIADDQAIPARPMREEDVQFRSELETSAPVQDTRFAPAPSEAPRFERPPFLRGSSESATVFRHPAAPAEQLSPGAVPQRPAVPQGTVSHIAAPQFAMPDMPRVASPVTRDPDAEAALLQFTAPASQAGSSPAFHQTQASEPQTAHPRSEEPKADPALFSSATDQSVTAAFNKLAATRLVENDDTLKEIVQDMLRPLLRDWLDDNLPGMVERLVRAEIERVGRGGR